MSKLNVVRRLSVSADKRVTTSLLGERRGSTGYASLTHRRDNSPSPSPSDRTVNVALNAGGFDGAIMAPKLGTTEDEVLVTIHITSGHPRGDDLVLLLNDDCTRIVSELPLSLCHAPAGELTLTTAVLNPPKYPGKYIAGLYSQKASAVVLLSERTRIRTVATAAGAHAGSVGSGSASPKSRSRFGSPASPKIATPAGTHLRRNTSDGGPEEPSTPGSALRTAARMGFTAKPMAVGLTPKASGGGGTKGWGLAADRLRGDGFSSRNHPSVRMHTITRPMTGSGRVRALIVGCAYFKQPCELGGPSNDVVAMTNVLSNYCGVVPYNLVTLSEGSLYGPDFHPTAANIRRAIRWLTHECRGDDHLIFYFSGAGARLPPANAILDADPSCDNALLPVDCDFGHRTIKYGELASTLFANVMPTTAVSVFIDACFGSTALDAYGGRIDGDVSATVLPAGITSLRRRRIRDGEPERARWRCRIPSAPSPLVVSGRPTHNWDSREPMVTRHGLRRLLFTPETQSSDHFDSAAAASFSESRNSPAHGLPSQKRNTLTQSMRAALGTAHIPDGGRFSLFEATREGSDAHYGAWDVFLREEGCTMGLFTYALGQVICQTALERDAGGPVEDGLRISTELSWHELEGRVKRMIRAHSGGRSQLPIGSHGHQSQLDRPVFPLGVVEEE